MRRFGALSIAIALFPLAALAVEPEECLVRPGDRPAATAEWGGKVYALASAECRDLFLSDPERYAQLFDALAELGVQPAEPEPADDVALVPN